MKEVVKASPRYFANKTLKINQQENTKGKAVRALADVSEQQEAPGVCEILRSNRRE